jgi:hypothetical protein
MPAVLLLGGAAVAPRDVHIPSASTAPQFRGGGGPRYSRPTGSGGWAAADAAIALAAGLGVPADDIGVRHLTGSDQPSRVPRSRDSGSRDEPRSLFRQPRLTQALLIPGQIVRSAKRNTILQVGNAQCRIDLAQALDGLPRFLRSPGQRATRRSQANG